MSRAVLARRLEAALSPGGLPDPEALQETQRLGYKGRTIQGALDWLRLTLDDERT